ncbi:MAG: M48 family metallopeptidase [Bacteroidales bacterium]|nr:M48 family metallopeptidase [Bacteroidales bacterium]
MKKLLWIALSVVLVAIIYACSSVALTGRKQVLLYSNSDIMALSEQSYKEFAQTAKASTNAAMTQKVRVVCSKLLNAMNNYFITAGLDNPMQGLNWHIDLVKSEEINAFCLPSGNIVVYEGLANFVDNDDQRAAVVGHEIAHAIANHRTERMSRATLTENLHKTILAAAQASGKVTDSQLAVFNTALGLGGQYGVILPFSRKQELEADHIGLIMMAVAGYKVEEAPKLWVKMSQNGQQVPEFMSTHPSDVNRIKNLEKYMEEAKAYAGK